MQRSIQTQRTARLSLIPAFVLTVLLLLVPGFYVIWQSLSNGLSSYWIVFNDQQFANGLLLSLKYVAITVPIQLLIGTMAAVIVHQLHIYSRRLMIALFAPYAVPSVVAVLSWKFLIEDKGMYALLMNKLLGVPNNAWKNELVFWSLCLISIWQFFPFVFVSVLARLRRIHTSLYRTAQLDGAGFWQQFRVVTFPEISSTLFAVLLVRIAFMFTKFDTAWLLAGKASVNGVHVLPIYIYISSFRLGNISQCSAAAMMSAFALASLLICTKLFSIMIVKLRHHLEIK
jgi:multiple sugar transport system permease protein